MTENLTITGVVVGFLLGWIIAIVIENWPVTGYGPPERKNYNPPPEKRKGSVPKMVDPPPPPERIATLKVALYRTRKDRDKYKELYLSEKERADRHRERLREKRLELFKLKNKNQC